MSPRALARGCCARKERHGTDTALPRPGRRARAALMARSAQSVLKRAREQALREKRQLKQAEQDARSAQRRGVADWPTENADTDAAGDAK
jgi:hypothetical protein